MPKPGLHGFRILVTRPKGEEGELVWGLARQGASVIHVPTIRIAPPRTWKPLDAALRRLPRYDWILFTSAQGVRSLFGRGRRLGLRDSRLRIGVVGPKTAEAVRREGFRVSRVAQEHRGEALAGALGPVRGQSVLLATADKARKELARLLERAGARVDVVTAYRTLAAREGGRLRTLARRGRLDLVVFTSSSTAENLARLLGRPAFRRLFRTARAASIGPVTSATLRELGVRPAVEARPYTARGLIAAIKRWRV